jgi:hypothetical protein
MVVSGFAEPDTMSKNRKIFVGKYYAKSDRKAIENLAN